MNQIISPRITDNHKLRKVLQNPDSFATTIIAMALDRYGLDSFTWRPETWAYTLQEDFSIEIPAVTLDKLMAGLTVITTDLFYGSVDSFLQVCNIFSGDSFAPGEFNPTDAYETLWGLTEAMLLDPVPEGKQPPFSQDVIAYISAMMEHEGVYYPVDMLSLGFTTKFRNKVHDFLGELPEHREAIIAQQQNVKTDLLTFLQQRLKQLGQQLEDLPLRHGETDKLVRPVALRLQQVEAQMG